MTGSAVAAQTRPADPSTPLVGKEMAEAVAVLTLQHAPYNLLSREFTVEIIDALAWAKAQGARAVVIRSAARHFSAGADLDQMLAAAEISPELDWPLLDLLEAFRRFPAPIVAGVHGVCVGGGFELALACDLIVAAASSKIGSVEVTVGLHPLMGAIQRVAQRAGAARAAEMAMLGRRYDAATLERWGVINLVVPDEELTSATMVLAQELAHGPTVCHAATKELLAIAITQGIEAADQAMSQLQKAIFASADFRTGARSYQERGVGMARFEGR
ncbi:MAG TPA: enoyl-CoA hydratase/isomerase family protein [Sporichthyaceae bacterium]|nr:enoyl-CoA hydratase/isomerase family protein [Sporichthyaceae bacterium]